MPPSSAAFQQVIDALARGWVVVTGNQRAARTLRRAYDLHRRQEGLPGWTPPNILAWETWLHSLYRIMVVEGRTADVLLNAAQEHTLWLAIVSGDTSISSLRPMDALADAASGAWDLLHAYRGRQRLRGFAGNADTRAFARWAGEFERSLRRGDFISRAQLPERLSDAILSGDVTVPAGLLLVGFDGTTPAQKHLLDSLQKAGAEIASAVRGSIATTRTLTAAASDYEELLACAHWVRSVLQQSNAAQIAIIVPSIEGVRAEIDRQFRSILAPELNDIAAANSVAPYEFSLGVPLAQTAMVAAALDLLRWVSGPLPIERISALLLSPYFAAAPEAERLPRAEFDAFLLRRQKLLQPCLSADGLRRLLRNWQRSVEVPTLIHHLAALRSAAGAPELPMLSTHARWAESMAGILAAAGWAAGGNVDSGEFQTRRKFEAALDELATLDFDDQQVPWTQAVTSLEHILQRTLFAPESRHAPVQIMGPLEAAGSQFDAIWFLRANDAEWSTTSSPNPLLPWQMQRELGMPGAVPSADAELARRRALRIASSTPHIVFSYARQSAEGPQRPSAALANLELERADASVLIPQSSAEAPLLLESVPQAPIPQPPDVVHLGGASVLEHQAACAFRAFAEHRLFSAALDSPALGLDFRDQGSVVHKVLQLFWESTHGQSELRALSEPDRNERLDRCIDEALDSRAAHPEAGWGTAYLDAQRQRLRNLLRPWLAYEQNERPSFAVKAVEQDYRDVQIGPLHLRVKVDRIDTALLDGEPAGEIILDYKTGMANPADWIGDRPQAPQLPLYAVVAGTPELAAVAFAAVRPGNKREMRGIEARPRILPKARKPNGSLAAQVEEWRRVLVTLAEDFHSGHTEVRPKKYPDTCRYCQQRLLCRLDPATLTADVTEETEELTADEDYG